MLRNFIPFFDPEVKDWAIEARLLRWLTFLWLTIGLVALFSASYVQAKTETGDGLYYFERQLVWIILGAVGLNFVVRSPLNHLYKAAPWLLLFLLGLILITSLVPGVGTSVNGATRWLAFGPFLIQPSELIKPFLVLQSACVFGQWQRLPKESRVLWLVIFALVLAGILLQPNLSTTALCGMMLWLVALAGGIRWRYLGGVALAGTLVAYTSITIHDYQRQRVLSFLNPWSDSLGNGYQLVQSLLAIGSGGTWGTGYGLSQQKLFLPIQYTDFIFSVFAEEFGFVGGLLLLLLLLSYATLALIVALKCRHRVQRLVAVGVMVAMVGQSLLNIGVATGALPTTGLPLPMFSYGGSSTIASFLLAALLIRVARESNEAEVVSIRSEPTTD